MATLDQVTQAVVEFATSSTLAITPGSITEPIVPSPAAMTDLVFNQFYFDLLSALGSKNISARAPMESVRGCTNWSHVAVLVFHFQVPAGGA